MLIMSKISTPSQRKVLCNHPSWKDDQAAQAPIISRWLAQGVLEFSGTTGRLFSCSHEEPYQKGTALFQRLITDARYCNTVHVLGLGCHDTFAAEISAALQPHDFEDLECRPPGRIHTTCPSSRAAVKPSYPASVPSRSETTPCLGSTATLSGVAQICQV